MKIKNTEIKIIRGDIAALKVDCIVNCANIYLKMESGLSGFLKKKGGEKIEAEAVKKGPLRPGEVVATKAGKLKAKRIIHAVSVDQKLKTDEVVLRGACGNALRLADQLKAKSIAFPALGCGIDGFPAIGAAKIMAQEALKYLRNEKARVQEIIFCLNDAATFKIFDKHVQGYIQYMRHKQEEGPYVTVDAIIELKNGIILIERSNPPYGWALPGGFVDYGESLEDAVAREAKEETNLDLENVRQFHCYSNPGRDPRFHTIATVFIAQGKGRPQFGDDAKGLKVIQYEDLLDLDYAFDHKQIIRDYLKQKGAP